MSDIDWSPVVEAGARAYMKTTHGDGAWEQMRVDEQHRVREMVLPILRAGVAAALDQSSGQGSSPAQQAPAEWPNDWIQINSAAEVAWKAKSDIERQSSDQDWWQGFEDGWRASRGTN